jgi:hypothetical protein
MKKIYLLTSMIIVLSIFSASVLLAQDKTLLVVGAQATADAHLLDGPTVDSLESWGFGVIYSEDGAFGQSTEDILTDIYGLVLCESMSSGTATNFKSWGYPVPCLNMELYLPQEGNWGWLTSDTEQFSRHEGGASGDATEDDEFMIIKDNTHYITEIYDVDEEIRFTDPPSVTDNIHGVIQEATVEHESNLAKLKSYPEDEWWFLFTVEAPESGENMVLWGYNAQGMIGSTADGVYATQDFWTIMRRSAQWVFDEEEEEEQPEDVKEVLVNRYNLKVNPNPAWGITFARFHATAGSNAVVSVLSMIGQEIEVIYSGEVNNTKNIPFDVSGYPPGMYFLKLQINNEFQISKFVVK